MVTKDDFNLLYDQKQTFCDFLQKFLSDIVQLLQTKYEFRLESEKSLLYQIIGFTNLDNIKEILPSFLQVSQEQFARLKEITDAKAFADFVLELENGYQFLLGHVNRIWDYALDNFKQSTQEVINNVNDFLSTDWGNELSIKEKWSHIPGLN